MFIPQGLNKEKFIACLKHYFPSIEPEDVRTPLLLSRNVYVWSCSCGCDVSSDGRQEMWANILHHLCTSKHDLGTRAKIEYIEKKMNEINDKLAPSTLDSLEPQIMKLKAQYQTIAKWAWQLG